MPFFIWPDVILPNSTIKKLVLIFSVLKNVKCQMGTDWGLTFRQGLDEVR